MIATLPMYDRASNRAAHDALWALIRNGLCDRGIAAPDGLARDVAHDAAWGRDDLVLSQICNLPYRTVYRGKVALIGAADYGLAGCAAGFYNSVVIVRKDSALTDLTSAFRSRFAVNDLLSQSGYGAVCIMARRQGIELQPAMVTGAHAASLAAVATGRADAAAIDAQTWRMLQAEDAHAADVRVIGTTDTSPGMTFITRAGSDTAPYFAAIKAAIAGLAPADRATLGLREIVALPPTAYDLPIPGKTPALA